MRGYVFSDDKGETRMKRVRVWKAFILSWEHGTVQIGKIVFQPCTGARFEADLKGLRGLPWYWVSEQSMSAAREALEKFTRQHAESLSPGEREERGF